MAFRKKGTPENRPRSNGAKRNLSQFGLLEMPDLSGLDGGMSDDDEDEDTLEAELNALLSGKTPVKAVKKPKQAMDIDAIAKMAAECANDDENFSDENLSSDEELMAELHGISGETEKPQPSAAMISPLVPTRAPPSVPTQPEVPARPKPVVAMQPQVSEKPHAPQAPAQKEMSLLEMLTERLDRYKEAEVSAKALGETTKARRFYRAIKTLETLIKEAKAGKPIGEENIPPAPVVPKRTAPQPGDIPPLQPQLAPPVAVEMPAPQSEKRSPVEDSVPAAPKRTTSITKVSSPDGNSKMHQSLCLRCDQYKMAALAAKKSGDMETAKNFVKISKQFQAVIEAVESGQPVDLSNMPPPPPVQDSRQLSDASPRGGSAPIATTATPEPQFQLPPEANEPEDPSLFNAPPPPSSIQEALEQRLDKFRTTQKAALTENNDSKARRLNRIIKQYEVALKDFKAGKPVAFEELVAPPGFGPIPIPAASEPEPKPKAPIRTVPAAPSAPTAPQRVPQKPSTSTPPKLPVQKKMSNRSPSSLMDKQLSFLLERQRLFKAAAFESKQNGDIQQAKEYLRMCKGFDPMIEATKCGLPIDATTIPTPPQLQGDYVVVEATECLPDDMEKQENFRALERDLTRQIDICLKNKEHFLQLGDVSSASKFEKFCQDTRRDLLVVQNLWTKEEQLPKFHYETRLFSMVQCHPHLADNEVELKVMRGINLPGKPTELDSYVKIEFPFPSETPQHAKTYTVKDTNNPDFKAATFKFEINRKSRTLGRVLKRHAIKLEVWSKGGFLRSDTMLGTASVKLIELEKKCTIHDSFDLMDGRKACGGKLEVQISIREPLLAKQIEEVKERWLVVGS